MTDTRQATIVRDLRASAQVAEVSGDDLDGEIDPRVVHTGATAAPHGSRPDAGPSAQG